VPTRVYNFHKDIKQFICAETLLSAVSLSFREIYGFPFILHFPLLPSFIVPCQIFTVSFFIFRIPTQIILLWKFSTRAFSAFLFNHLIFVVSDFARCGEKINN
jgi:hypothetical protein